MIVIKAPTPLPARDKPWVFVAGSIEQGAAEDWQAKVEQALEPLDCYLLNPRRESWDSTWVQRASNPIFREQVEWELNGLLRANVVLMYFDPKTKAPISLLELGLIARTAGLAGVTVIVACPDEFYRKGNVELVCERYNITLVNSLDELIATAKLLTWNGASP